MTEEKPKPAKAGRQRKRTIEVDGSSGYYTSYGYRSARVASKEGRSPVKASGKRHMEYDRVKLVAQSRQFMRDNSIYSGMIRTAVNYIIGENGITLQARTDDKDYNSIAEENWREYQKSPEIRGLLSGVQVQSTLCRELLVAGDTGAIKLKNGKLQLIEAEQIVSGRKLKGINLKRNGEISSFSIAPYSAAGFIQTTKAGTIAAANFFYLSDPDRPSGTRSVPPLQASFAMLHRINDVCDAEAIAWQMLARFAISINRNNAANQAYVESIADPEKTGSNTSGDIATRVHQLDYALIFQGEDGEEIKGIERNIPAKTFGETLRDFLRLCGLPLGLPLELIYLDWTQSNYSQSRAVLEHAYLTFTNWQKLIINRFLIPDYERKVRQWIREGKLKNNKQKFKAEWLAKAFPWIDQLKEAQAWGTKLDRGLTTQARALKSLGQDREEVVIAREAEVRDAIARARKIEEETGEKVPWRIFAGLKEQKTDLGRPAGSAPAMVPADKETTE